MSKKKKPDNRASIQFPLPKLNWWQFGLLIIMAIIVIRLDVDIIVDILKMIIRFWFD